MATQSITIGERVEPLNNSGISKILRVNVKSTEESFRILSVGVLCDVKDGEEVETEIPASMLDELPDVERLVSIALDEELVF